MKRIIIPLSLAFTLSTHAEDVYPNTTYEGSNITADGQEIKFTYDGTVAGNPDAFFFTHFYNSELNATNNGSINMEANAAYLHNSSISIDGTSTLNSAGISITEKSSLENHGTINVRYISMEDGTAVNYGTINDTDNEDELLKMANGSTFTNYGTLNNDVYITISGGSSFYAENGSAMGSFDVGEWYIDENTIMKTNTLYINGNVDMYGELSLYELGEIVFTLDSTLDMNGNDIIPDGGTIVLQLDEALTDTTQVYKKEFFTNYSLSEWDDEAGKWVEYSADNLTVVVRGSNGVEKTMTMKELTIPEPTSASLTLLALAGLAARRRRK